MPIKQVTLGDQILHGQDRAGQWVVEKLGGWYDAPESKGGGEARPLSDGDFEGQVNYGPRMVTVDGILFHRSRGDLVSAMERFNGLAKLSTEKFLVTDAGLSRYSNVKSLGTTWTAHTLDASRFQIRLKAVDPFKYGESYAVVGTSSSPPVLYQRGTVPAWPVVTISGTASSSSGAPYTLTLNGRSVTVSLGRFAADPAHEIDFKTGILRVGGVVARGGFSTANFSPINPGLAQTMSTTVGGVTVRYSDTYI